jgi:hypothetical protein
MREFPEVRKRYWGCRAWGKEYFCSTIGAVTEEMVKKYIEDQMRKILLSKYGTKRKIYPLSAYLQILSTLPALAGSH